MSLKYQQTKQQRMFNIACRTYYCEECEKAFRDITTLNTHLNSYKHNPGRYTTYDCEICNFHTKIKTAMNKHIKTQKHRRLSPPENHSN